MKKIIHSSCKPISRDHDHEDYFSKSFTCGNCGESLGSYDYGRAWCDEDKEKFKKDHANCPKCGTKIDWSEF